MVALITMGVSITVTKMNKKINVENIELNLGTGIVQNNMSVRF